MIDDEIKLRVLRELGFEPTREQQQALGVFCSFITSHRPRPTMVMRGAAGTGKTALAGAMVRAIKGLGLSVVLMAPTGRAAKMLAQNAHMPASTIHRRIYREGTFSGVNSRFNLSFNPKQDVLFVVDEASMISNQGSGQMDSPFGSGRLMDDLFSFVFQQRGCRLLLVGDKAQLPPVGEAESPALSAEVLRNYGLTVSQCDLTEVVRQQQQSGILYNATTLRIMLSHDRTTELPRVRFSGFADIRLLHGADIVEQLQQSYREVGIDETTVITRSNKRANIYNQGIRRMVLDREEALSSGDMVMVVRNKYFTEDGKEKFLANGDRAVVRRVHNTRELYGLHFADLDLELPDYDNREMTLTTVLDTLASDLPQLSREQREKLFAQVMDDYFDVPLKRDRLQKVREDDYYNALEIKFAYAITCHKAQGGQWEHVYVDQGYMTDDMMNADYLHWLYTAFTRATRMLYLVNWPKPQTEGATADD